MDPVSGSNFESYIESWQGKDAAMQILQKMNINSNTTIDISFASFDFSSGNALPGLEFGNNPQDLSDIVSYIHSQGGHVKMSFGGATYPLGPSLQSLGPDKLAADIANVVNTYGLDGVDLDIEDKPTDTTNVLSFIQSLHTQMGSNADLSLTVPGQDWGEQGWISAAAPYVSVINFMEYDIWVADGSTNTAQIESDINTYVNDWGIPANKIQLGLMPGGDDVGHQLSIQDAQTLTNFAVSKGLAGVMIWDLNRDTNGSDGQGAFAYTTAIENILFGNN